MQQEYILSPNNIDITNKIKNIVIVGPKGYDNNQWHLRDAFEHLGYNATIIGLTDPAKYKGKVDLVLSKMSENYERSVAIKLAKKVIASQPDIVISTMRSLHPAFVETARVELATTKFISLNVDPLTNFDRQQLLASDYDIFFSKEPFTVDFMKNKMGLNAHFLPEYFNPRIHRRPEISKSLAEEQTKIDVLSMGTMYPYRTALLQKLIDAGLNVSIHGRRSKYFPKSLEPYFDEGFVYGKEKSALIYGAKIVFNNFHFGEVSSANQKYFEINGIGGFQICDYKDSLKEYSPVDTKKYTFRTIEEAIELIRYYLNHDEERYEIAQTNYEYFLKNHTIDIRVQQLLDIVEGGK